MDNETISLELSSAGENAGINWLAVFFILDEYELNDELAKLKTDLKNIKVRGEVKIFLIKDSIRHIRGIPGSSKQKTTTYEFKFNKETGKTECNPFPVDDIDVTAKDAWAKVLGHLITLNGSNNSVLITWSHGAGIAIQNSELRTTSSAVPAATGSPCSVSEYLFVSEIAQALQGRKLDMIAMTNCYTQTFDNCYNLRHCCRYYIAATRGMQKSGYDFVKFIKTINTLRDGKLDDSEYKKLATDLVDSFWERSPSFAARSAVMVNNLGFIKDEWIISVNLLISYLIENQSATFPILRAITTTEMGDVSSGSYFFDAVSLFRITAKKLRSQGFDKLLSDFLAPITVGQLLVYPRVGTELLVHDRRYQQKFLINDFSVHLHSPDSASTSVADVIVCQYQQKAYYSEFVEKVRWAELVNAFISWRTAHP